MPETVDIFQNKKTGLFLLQRKCPNPELKGPTSYGEPEILTEEDLRRDGVAKVTEALAVSLKPCPDPRLIKHSSEKEYRDFCGAHNCVTVARWPDADGRLELYPLGRVAGGYRSIKEAKRVVAKEDIGSQLVDEILAAFVVIKNA